MAPELLTRRSSFITSLPILTLLLHVFLGTHCFAQRTQMNKQRYIDDGILNGADGAGLYLCLPYMLEYHQGQFIQRPKIEKPLFEKANRITAPAYSLLHQRMPESCRDYHLSRIYESFELGYNQSTYPSFLIRAAPNMTKMP